MVRLNKDGTITITRDEAKLIIGEWYISAGCLNSGLHADPKHLHIFSELMTALDWGKNILLDKDEVYNRIEAHSRQKQKEIKKST